MTKIKKEKLSADGEEAAAADGTGTEKSYQELIANVNPIAQPLASKKLSKKLYKCVKKGNKETLFSFRKRQTAADLSVPAVSCVSRPYSMVGREVR